MHHPKLVLIYKTKCNTTAKSHNWTQRLQLDVGETLLRPWKLFLSIEDILTRCYPFRNEWKWIFPQINMFILIIRQMWSSFGACPCPLKTTSRAIARYYHLVAPERSHKRWELFPSSRGGLIQIFGMLLWVIPIFSQQLLDYWFCIAVVFFFQLYFVSSGLFCVVVTFR